MKHGCAERVEYLHALYGKLIDDMDANHRREVESVKSAWFWYSIAAFNLGLSVAAIAAVVDAVLR